MTLKIYCDGFKTSPNLENIDTQICSISSAKWIFTLMMSGLILAFLLFIRKKYKYRCHKTLLTFHNLRAAVSLLLLVINTLELARTFLQWPIPSDLNTSAPIILTGQPTPADIMTTMRPITTTSKIIPTTNLPIRNTMPTIFIPKNISLNDTTTRPTIGTILAINNTKGQLDIIKKALDLNENKNGDAGSKIKLIYPPPKTYQPANERHSNREASTSHYDFGKHQQPRPYSNPHPHQHQHEEEHQAAEESHSNHLHRHRIQRQQAKLLKAAYNDHEYKASEDVAADVNADNVVEDDDDGVYAVIFVGIATLWNSLAAILLTIMLIWYHRIIELKKAVEFLYVSAAVELLISVMRTLEYSEVLYYQPMYELESCLQGFSSLCLLGLAFLDGFTIYKERYRADYLEDYEKIGYKHSLATFYSKTIFWWLTPLLWLGYKEPLELEDLGQMRLEDSARAHYDRFLLIYKTEKVKNSDRSPSLWLCYIKHSWRMFALGGVLKFFGDLFALIGPLAIQYIVQYIETIYSFDINNNNSNNNSNSIINNNNISNNINDVNNGNGMKMFTNNNSNNNNNNSNNQQRILRSININNNNNHNSSYSSNRSSSADSSHSNGSSISGNYNNSDKDNYISIVARDLRNLNDNYNNNFVNNYLNISHNITEVATPTTATTFSQDGIALATTEAATIATEATKSALTTGGTILTTIFNKLNIKAITKSVVENIWPVDSDQITHAFLQQHFQQAPYLSHNDLYSQNYNLPNSRSHFYFTNEEEAALAAKLNLGYAVKISYITWNELLSNGWIIAWIVLLAALAQSGLSQASTHILNMTGIQIKTSLQGLIYRKTLLLNSNNFDLSSNTKDKITEEKLTKESKEPTVNANVKKPEERSDQGISDVGAITNLMSEDTLNIMSFFWIAHYVWAIPLKKFTDDRLKLIHDTFLGIKLIKLNAWDSVFLRRIRNAREKELQCLNRNSWYWNFMTILTHLSSVLVTCVTLAVYVFIKNDGKELSASHLFSALALFQQLTVLLLIFPITVPIIISAVVSTRRLERFLQLREIQKEFEGIRNMARILSKSDASLDMYEIKEKSNSLDSKLKDYVTHSNVQATNNKRNVHLQVRMNVPSQLAPLAHSEPITPLIVNEINNPFVFQQEPNTRDISNDCLKKVDEDREKHRTPSQRREILRKTPYVVIRPRRLTNNQIQSAKKVDSWQRDSLLLKISEDIAVSIKDGAFAWNPDNKDNVLQINDITIPKGKLTIVVGKTGSGKTSLLSGLLMELPLVSGDMIWHKTSTIAYVPQQPWLLNATIRENILFGEPIRPKRYDFVLEACALKPDIELMPEADLTIIGERGINLSGGQRQRIAIARAIYSSANVVIMDDPLSSLDNEVARHVFELSIKKMLLIAKRTVIMVTQQLQLLQQADYLIAMKNCSLQAAGSYQAIQTCHPEIVSQWMKIIQESSQKDKKNIPALGKTARERWKLFKNVSKLSLQRTASIRKKSTGDSCSFASHDIDTETDCDDCEIESLRSIYSSSQSSLPRRSSVYGSRHLMYDLPIPIDECQTEDVILRRRPRSLFRQSSSRASSRLSGFSSISNEVRRSEVTTSLSSNGSGSSSYLYSDYDNANANTLPKEKPRVQSWQPTATSVDGVKSKLQRKKISRNVSLPTDFQQSSAKSKDCHSADPSADLAKSKCCDTSSPTVGGTLGYSGSGKSGFQQFLHRMSMRSSNLPKTSAAHRIHRPVSDTNSILSITEESSIQQSPVSSIEMASISSDTPNGSETENWIERLQNEDYVEDGNMDYKELKANGRNFKNTRIKTNNEKMRQSTRGGTTMGKILTDCIDMKSSVSKVPILPEVEVVAEAHTETESQSESGGHLGQEQQRQRVCEDDNVNEIDYIDGERISDEPETVAKAQTKSGPFDGSGIDGDNGAGEKIYKITIPSRGEQTKILTSQMASEFKTKESKGTEMRAVDQRKKPDTKLNTIVPIQPVSRIDFPTESKTPKATTRAITNIIDSERKYGKISIQIYLLYLRACGIPIVVVYFLSTLIWQGLRVYTDFWLQYWTEDNTNINGSGHIVASNVTPIVSIQTADIGGMGSGRINATVAARTRKFASKMLTSVASLISTATATAASTSSSMSSLSSSLASSSFSTSLSSGTSTTPSISISEFQASNSHHTTTTNTTPDITIKSNEQQYWQQHEITYYFSIYTIISCVCIIMAMISTPTGQWAGCNARRILHDKLLQTIMGKSLYFFQVTPLGRLMSRFSCDMSKIDNKLAATFQRLVQFALLCFCAVLINVGITPWFIPLTLPICIAYYAIQQFYRCSSRELQRIENSTSTPVISHLSETIQGVTTIRAYNQESRFTEILFRRLEANTIAFTILNTSNRWLGISLDYLGGVIVFVAILTALVAATISSSQLQQQMHINNQMQSLASTLPYGKNLSESFSFTSTSSSQPSGLPTSFPLPTTTTTTTTTTPMAAGATTATETPITTPSPSPSLVGLAINYTLLIPIYLNWVVKLLADIEMYIGSVERLAYYAEDSEGEQDTQDSKKPSKDEAENPAERDQIQGAEATTQQMPTDIKSVSDGVIISIPKGAHSKDLNENNNINELRQQAVLNESSATGFANRIVQRISSIVPRTGKYSITKSKAKKTKKLYKSVPISWPQKGDISFENVSLRYEGVEECVIKNLTLKIPAGQRIGFCGRTGSGKSSLVLSLFGVLQTTSGRICIDDVDITEIHPDEIRTRLSIIPQDVHLFNGTIRENLDPPGYYSDLEIWNCLEMAQLKEFVNGQLPMGLETEIGEGGINLSAGHRQLLCLARAILRGSVCLILDEATSFLDSATERALLTAAHTAFQGRTILTIAHRLSTILDYDRIILLENGKIIEDGNPRELQRKTDSAFHTLVQTDCCSMPSTPMSDSGVDIASNPAS